MKARKKLLGIATILTLLAGLGSCNVASQISAGRVYSYAECADGWKSPSIGIQGACSHHGGVVIRNVDNRTNTQKTAYIGLDIFGVLCLLLTPLLFLNIWNSTPGQHHIIESIRIEGDTASVPLTIAGETRDVNITRVNETSFETLKSVALFKCPAGKRSGVYVGKVVFRGRDGEYRQDLSTWINTGKGRNGGYMAQAFKWSSEA